MFNGRRFARFTFTPPAGTLFQPSSLTGWKNASNTVRCALPVDDAQADNLPAFGSRSGHAQPKPQHSLAHAVTPS